MATIHNFCHRDVICSYCGHHSFLWPPSTTSVAEILFVATVATTDCCGHLPQLLSQRCCLWLLWPPQFAVETIHNFCRRDVICSYCGHHSFLWPPSRTSIRDVICSYCGHHSFLWPPSTTSVTEMLFVATVATIVYCHHLPQLLSQRCYLWLQWPP